MKSSKPDKVVDISDFGDKKRLAFLSQLVNDNQQALMRFLRVRLANEADRDDIMQEVYLRLCRIEKLADKLSLGEAPTRAFLFRVATNLIHDHFRRQGVRHTDAHCQIDELDISDEKARVAKTLQRRQRLAIIWKTVDAQKPAS